MLFDLRSRGRRRTVQTVYLGLAILMIVGLVGVGVGAGNGVGGIFNAFTNNGSGSGGAQKQVVSQQEKQALAQTRAHPNDPKGWGSLLQARWTAAGQGANYNTSSSSFTASGKKELASAASAWQRYISLTSHPDPSLAVLAARTYVALGNYSGAASAWEQESTADPSAAKGYECVAVNAYAAGQTRVANLASAKALSMQPKASQAQTKQLLNQAKSSKSSARQLAQGC
jgi:predicted Zn-dependent protease